MLVLKNLLIFLIIVSLNLNLCTADDNVIFLPKGKESPYDGYLFTPISTQNIRKELIEKDKLKELNDSLNKSIDLYKVITEKQKTQLELALKQNDELSKTLIREKNSGTMNKVVFFGLGILATGLAVYGAKQITK